MKKLLLMLLCVALALTQTVCALGDDLELELGPGIVDEGGAPAPEIEIEPDIALDTANVSVDGLGGLTLDSLESTAVAPGAQAKNETEIFIPDSNYPDRLAEYRGDTSTVEIPSHYTSIGGGVFQDHSEIKEIIFPAGLQAIEGGAFANCDGLTEVTLPNQLVAIGGWAFQDCNGLTSISIPGSVVSLGDDVFRNCTALRAVNLSEGLISIGSHAFTNSGLERITLPNTVSRVGEGAFGDCTKLISATLSNSLTSLEGGLFWGCSSLSSIVVPDGVTTIGTTAFVYCDKLASVTLSNALATIDVSAFEGCASLNGITLPGTVTGIGENAFKGCTSLTSIALPDSLVSLGQHAFQDCKALYQVTLSKNLTTIPDEAFRNTGLKQITLHEGLTSIGEHAFEGCAALSSVALPSTLNRLGTYVFSGCSSLSDVTLSASITEIPSRAFEGTGLSKIALHEGITSIGDNAFRGSALVEIALPGGLKKLGDCAFWGCEQLKSVEVPASITSMSDSAFEWCKPTIIGERGSYAERYAQTHDLPFRGYGEKEVVEPTAIKLNKSGTVSLERGKKLQLKAILTPSDAETTLTWTSDDEEIATVSSAGLVKGVSKGVTTVTATTANGLSASVEINVIAPKPTTVTITNGKSATLYMGNTLKLTAKLKPADAVTKLTWNSLKTSIATVKPSGKNCVVTPKKAGTVKITVTTSNEKSATITVKVIDASGVKIKEGKSKTLKVGKKLTLHAVVSPSKVKTKCKWTSSNTKVATVSSKGVVTARKKGTAKITVRTANKKSATITIKVN